MQLSTGANPNIPDYDEEKTPLHEAAANGYGKVGCKSRSKTKKPVCFTR